MDTSARSGSRAPAATAGISAALTEAGITVVEVNRTRPAERRKQGKSDRLDAYRAARAVVAGDATTEPKRASIEPLRALSIARRSAVKAQQAPWRQICALLINASAGIRGRYRDMPEAKLDAALATTRPAQITDLDLADTLYALRSLARRHQRLSEEIDELQERMRTRATAANPALLAIKGVGPVIGTQLLITAGDKPDSAAPPSPGGAEPRPSGSAPHAPTGTGSPVAVTGPPTRPAT